MKLQFPKGADPVRADVLSGRLSSNDCTRQFRIVTSAPPCVPPSRDGHKCNIAADQDALNKLDYDQFYLKNGAFDLATIFQTIRIILGCYRNIGRGLDPEVS